MRYSAYTRYIKTVHAGEAEFYTPRERGTVRVFYDNKFDVFKFGPTPDKRAAKKAMLEMYKSTEKLTGSWPIYKIEEL